MRRLCVYFFYDKDGIVDDYVPVYLKAMREHFSDICVVVNGKLTKKSESKLKKVSDKLIVRDNVGFDSWAYKEALYSYGMDNIAKDFDEVLLNNFTCYGPIGSFKQMFDKMDKSVCDFWGHCRYFPSAGQFVGGLPIPEHLMSYFVLFRKNILQSKSWGEYWETLKPVTNYDEARLFHEFRLTPYFEKRGFISDSFCNDEHCYSIAGRNASVHDAYYETAVDRSPLLKRKVFFVKDGTYCFWAAFSRYNKILYYIKRHRLYDLKLVFDNLIRTGDFSFGKNRVTFWHKIKWGLLSHMPFLLKCRLHYCKKIAICPDFKFIKKQLNKAH